MKTFYAVAIAPDPRTILIEAAEIISRLNLVDTTVDILETNYDDDLSQFNYVKVTAHTKRDAIVFMMAKPNHFKDADTDLMTRIRIRCGTYQ